MIDEGQFIQFEAPTVEDTYLIEWTCQTVCPPCTVPCILLDRPWCPIYANPAWSVTIW